MSAADPPPDIDLFEFTDGKSSREDSYWKIVD
jgi:hypothetical protein